MAKDRYASAKQGPSQLKALRREVRRLRDQLAAQTDRFAAQTVVIKVVKETRDFLLYGGRRYKRGSLVSQMGLGVHLDPGVGLFMTDNRILSPEDVSRNSYFEYLLQT
ncbi:hypothetical protein [Spirosoma pollinicola]|uniref:Uncharacterized protein n=1 Tax=Spirosoma pollinicola TaxID=2057025 RepID=A0A2K8ZAH5_9BACT|nr:hypothetical protein [Spirosoma pollinicola]AUD06871.1 hypothetical protein CWM47_36520 [Spirosoma pollinicola]